MKVACSLRRGGSGPVGTTKTPPTTSAGSRLAGVDAPWFTCGGSVDKTRSIAPLSERWPVACPRPHSPWWLSGRRVHHTSFHGWWGVRVRTPRSGASASGAAGSRTRVPRSRSCGLYVRRSWIISGTVLLDQTASVTHTVSGVPAALDGRSQQVELGDVDPLPLPSIGGGSSQVFKLREPVHRWHLKFPTRDSRGRVGHPRHAPTTTD